MQEFFIDFNKYFPNGQFLSQNECQLAEEYAADNVGDDVLLNKQR